MICKYTFYTNLRYMNENESEPKAIAYKDSVVILTKLFILKKYMLFLTF